MQEILERKQRPLIYTLNFKRWKDENKDYYVIFCYFYYNIIFSNENTINNFINDNDINIGLGFDEIPIIRINLKASSSSQNKIGYIIIKNGQISSWRIRNKNSFW